MAGILRIEVSGATKEELKRQLQDVIRELDKINFRPGQRLSMGNPAAWKVGLAADRAWKIAPSISQVSQAWKIAPSVSQVSRAWKTSPADLQAWKVETFGSRSWKVTYETY